MARPAVNRLPSAVPSMRFPVAGALLLPFIGAAAAALSPGCRSATRAPSARVQDPVAVVDGVAIGRAAVAVEMRRSGRGAREALADLIDFELLATAAARALGADPDLDDTRDRAAVQRMIERELEPKLTREAIPDSLLHGIYEKAHSVFVHPRLVQVALLSVYTGVRMKDAPRARALETAHALDAYVRSHPSATPDDFEAIASLPAWRDARVKHNRLFQAIDQPFSADVGRVVATLQHPGDTTPLMSDESGYHIARYVSERPPENLSFVDARERLRDEIAARWKQGQFLEYAQAAANPHQIEGFPERFDPSH
jgi:hypothetical protein